MRPYHFIAGITVLVLAACSPDPPESASETAAVAAAESDPGPKPATSAVKDELASPDAASASGQCRAEIGETAAQALADRCRVVSPATHPPCNAANSCRMIQDEIDRSCAMWDKDTSQPKPKECTA